MALNIKELINYTPEKLVRALLLIAICYLVTRDIQRDKKLEREIKERKEQDLSLIHI